MYLFFVRHFNDIDHIAPVVWRMKRDNYPVAVYCMNPRYEISEDYRLQFLKNIGVTVNYLHHEFDQQRGGLHGLLHVFINKSFELQKRMETSTRKHKIPGGSLAGNAAGVLGSLFYKLTRLIYYNAGWAGSVLKRAGARVICFDHIRPSLYVVNPLLKAAGSAAIPAVSLPHGVLLYTNAAPKPKASDKRRFAKFNRFDHILVPNQLRKDLLVRSGVAGKKIFVLGSPRYCTEWLEQNKKILPRNTAADSRSPQKLKVVLMASKPQCQVDGVRLKYTLGLLAQLAGVDTRIKPHTRSSGEKNLVDDPRLSDASHVLTAQLCEWADVMLVVGSSVITEALMRGRPALYLKYLHDNTTLFEDLGACWIIHDEAELKNALLSLQADKTAVPYADENVAEYLSEVVYGRKSGRDVLHDYEQFIVGCASCVGMNNFE
jgi:hypothetical protein